MSTNDKIKNRIEDITSISKNYVATFIDLCDSEIEKLYFANLLYYLFKSTYTLKTGFEIFGNDTPTKNDKPHLDIKKFLTTDYATHNIFFDGFEPIYHEIDEISPALKLIGIAFWDEVRISKSGSGRGMVLYKNVYSIYPQYNVELENSNYRVDFAIICNHYEDRIQRKESKVAIECDGFEFHSKKEDLKRDTSRNRNFTRNGWKMYRFSGTEVYDMTNKDIDRLFMKLENW